MRNLLGYGCRKRGLHIARTSRLLIVSARTTDYWRQLEVGDDAEILYRQGWLPETVVSSIWPLVARQPIRTATDVILPTLHQLEFSAICRRTYRLVGQVSIHQHGDCHQLGGDIYKAFRAQGYGREMLRMVCQLAHRHFGIGRLVAGFEDDNTPSRRWLQSAGFTPTAGPSSLALPNGRQVASCWSQHTDPRARQQCPWLTERGQAKVAALVPANPAEDDYAGQLNAHHLRLGQQLDPGEACRVCGRPLELIQQRQTATAT